MAIFGDYNSILCIICVITSTNIIYGQMMVHHPVSVLAIRATQLKQCFGLPILKLKLLKLLQQWSKYIALLQIFCANVMFSFFSPIANKHWSILKIHFQNSSHTLLYEQASQLNSSSHLQNLISPTKHSIYVLWYGHLSITLANKCHFFTSIGILS